MNGCTAIRPLVIAVLALGLVSGPLTPLDGQVGGLLRRAAEKAVETVDPGVLLGEGKQPISTSLRDATFGVDSLDNFVPDRPNAAQLRIGLAGVGARLPDATTLTPPPPVPMRPMLEMQRTQNGGFVLQPGFWEMHGQSYCLKAGTHGPGGGDGYLFAPTEGPAADAVLSIVRNSVRHPEIEQRDIQVLLWAIIARAKFDDLDPRMKATASRLLTPQQLAMLNRSALDLLPGPALERALDRVPRLVKQALQAEAQLRQMLTSPGTSFEQMERVAVLAGVPGIGEGSRETPAGRWSRHPDGYYVRYLPQAYSYTVTQLWVPDGSSAVGTEFDPAAHIAVPGNTARQRLIQSGRVHASRS
jgi:hypothetical protein